MKEKKSDVLFNIKDVQVTQFSIALVILVFLMQCFLLYHLYNTNINLLQKGLNISIDEIYKADLNRRLVSKSGKKSPEIRYLDTEKPPGIDTLKVKRFRADSFSKKNPVETVSLAIEEYLSESDPIDLYKMDSIAGVILLSNNIELDFCSEIVNVETNRVLSTSLPGSVHSFSTLVSKEIFLDVGKTKALRIVLLNPMSGAYGKMSIMLVSTFILSVVLIYSFYYQRKAISKQKRLVELKNDFFFDVSHEMKRPLSVVSLVISSFEEEQILRDEEKRSSFLKMAKSEIDRMSNKTEMVLNLAKDDEGVFELHYTEFDIAEMASDLVDRYLYMSDKEVDIEIINDLNSSFIYADSEQMEHILSNLILNSMKYSLMPVRIIIKLYEENGSVFISVEDNGVGMTKEQQQHIFDKYYRVGNVLSAKGHGIGLNYVMRMVLKHKGELFLTSEPGRGSEFTIKLPQSGRNN